MQKQSTGAFRVSQRIVRRIVGAEWGEKELNSPGSVREKLEIIMHKLWKLYQSPEAYKVGWDMLERFAAAALFENMAFTKNQEARVIRDITGAEVQPEINAAMPVLLTCLQTKKEVEFYEHSGNLKPILTHVAWAQSDLAETMKNPQVPPIGDRRVSAIFARALWHQIKQRDLPVKRCVNRLAKIFDSLFQ